MATKAVFTIGHSNRPLDIFIALLESFNIELVVDIRTIPRSKHNPQFNFNSLPENLRNRKIDYCHEKNFGGLRKPQKDSPNSAWINPSFRGFADFMQTTDFQAALSHLIPVIKEKISAFMCAEALPWRCHRFLISDALIVNGFDVFHIMGIHQYKSHEISPWATVSGKAITYPSK